MEGTRKVEDLTDVERVKYDVFKGRLAEMAMPNNIHPYARQRAEYDFLSGEFEAWAEAVGLSEEEL